VLEELRVKLDFQKYVENDGRSSGFQLLKYDWLNLLGETQTSPCRDWDDL
jgi:hypothetical protein